MAGVNKITRSIAPKSVFESARAVISSAVSYNQGDLLYLNTTTHLLAVPAAETDGEFFLGIAQETIVSGKLASPYNTDVIASQAISDVAGPVYGVIAKLVSKTGDTWHAGDEAYLDPATGTRGVTSTGTKSIGIYQGPTVTAIAGQEIEVFLGTRYPSDVLSF